ncbi:uncharacterized protein LOC106013443, partial [Aplysia californica]|uniref:Uncharacterized protein LOC106013443 n=1 Tax=Aplysia californica TaxID=6500 RepID=A0ABM1ABR9_APLCA
MDDDRIRVADPLPVTVTFEPSHISPSVGLVTVRSDDEIVEASSNSNGSVHTGHGDITVLTFSSRGGGASDFSTSHPTHHAYGDGGEMTLGGAASGGDVTVNSIASGDVSLGHSVGEETEDGMSNFSGDELSSPPASPTSPTTTMPTTTTPTAAASGGENACEDPTCLPSVSSPRRRWPWRRFRRRNKRKDSGKSPTHPPR